MLLLIWLVWWLGAAEVGVAAESAHDLYEQGRFKEAMKRYNELDMEHPKDLRYRYNRGCAAYQAGDYQSAAAAFSSVVRRLDAVGDSGGVSGRKLRSRAIYNLGNAAFQQGGYQTAVEYYKEALQSEETRPDARHNLELALRRLKEKKEKEGESQDAQDGGQRPPEKKIGG